MTDIIKIITESGIVAVIRADSKEKAVQIVEACIKGGIKIIEITFTVPDADQVLLVLHNRYHGTEIILGAGTILNVSAAKKAVMNGAKFIVSPGFDLKTALYLQEINIPYLPGCLTVTEMMTALSYGCAVIKLFPGSVLGIDYVKAIRGPLPDIKIMPTGGVNLDNIASWFKAGVVAVGIGSELTAPAKSSDYQAITKLAALFIEKIKEVRATNG